MSTPTSAVPGTNRTRFDPCRPGFTDKVYKVEQGVELPVRIWPATTPASTGASWLYWIHGGGYQSGNPYAIAPWIHAAFGATYHIVSVGYRYIPEVGIKEQVQDCVDAFKWCQSNLASTCPGVAIDSYFVGGDSAGGCLAALMGHTLSPKPKAMLDVYGVVDFLDPHYWKPRPQASLPGDEAYQQRLKQALQSRDTSQAAFARPGRYHLALPFDTLKSFWGMPDMVEDREKFNFDCDLYDYANSKRMALTLRQDDAESTEVFEQWCRDFSALHLLDKTGAAYPPTYIIHGTGDVLVPVEESYAFEKKLESLDVPVEGFYPEGEPHGFDQRINGPEDEKDWKLVAEPAAAFINKHVGV